MKPRLRIGTRGSLLALWQAEYVKKLILEKFPEASVSITPIRTKGDKLRLAPFSEIGGKGVFVKEIEDALLEGRVDVAVHSLKDLPSHLPEGLHLGGVAKRHSALDALCSREGAVLDALPRGARVGTSSTRRTAQLLAIRGDLRIEPLRGNVDTRLKKLRTLGLDAIVLAKAGLERMGLEGEITEVFPPERVLPAPGQGIIAMEARQNDSFTNSILSLIKDAKAEAEAEAERAFLARLGGGCQVPLGCYSEAEGEEIKIAGLIASPDGREVVRDTIAGSLSDRVSLAIELAERILAAGGDRILSTIRSL
ncbi:MAG: hydroxymethylbilane synthase [Candidatus Caldarchaeum sp.]